MHDRGVSPIPPDPDGIISACRALHGAIDGLDEAAARSVGVSRNDLRCLNLLENGAISPGRIGTALKLTSGSVTAMIDRLERKGLVERERDPQDRRGVLVGATPLVFRHIGTVYRRFAIELLGAMARYDGPEREAVARHLHAVEAACSASISEQLLGPPPPGADA